MGAWLVELGHGQHIAFAVFEPGRLANGCGRDAIHRAKFWAVVLLERDASAAQLSNLCFQILDDPGGNLVLRGSGDSG